jgi:hypothetical protein
VNRQKLLSLTVAVAAGLGALGAVGQAQAFNFGDMMNPSRWFGGDRDRYYDRGYGYGYGGPYGWGGPYGGYGPYGGWGGPWGGYGYGPYGGWGGPYGGYGGYGPGSTIVVTPQGSGGERQQSAPAPRLPE